MFPESLASSRALAAFGLVCAILAVYAFLWGAVKLAWQRVTGTPMPRTRLTIGLDIGADVAVNVLGAVSRTLKLTGGSALFWPTLPNAPARPETPPTSSQAGHIRAAALGVLLLISAGLLTTRCRPATDTGYALAGLPAATQCTAREYRCNAGIPEVCERGNTSTGALRWWPTVPPGPDGRRVPCARCVVDVDGGRAHCGAVDAALATDGGAP